MNEEALSTTSLARTQIEVLGIAEGYFGSQVLFTANELGVFDLLAERPRSAREIAAHLAVDEDALARLLNAAVAVGLLDRGDGAYSNRAMTDAVLVRGRPGYLGNWMRLMGRWMRAWVSLTDVVRTGKPAEDPFLHLGGDPDYTRDFILGMHDYADLRGSEIVRHVDLSGGLRLLDLGGGPGSYAILFAKRWPDLHVDIFDLPEVVEIAAENCRVAGVDNRVTTVAGDYHTDAIVGEYDVIFISDVLHQEDPQGCEAILGKAHVALKPGGRLIVQGMFLNEDRTSPRWPVLHSLIVMVVYAGGRAYTVKETVDLMERAGFENCRPQRMSLLNVNSLIIADKTEAS